jgi:formylglycine-generating enzyme required for sulfatase activity
MGQVYLAEDTLLERPVALKLIASVRPDEAARQRFHAEARAIARLSHPNVVAVHRVGEVDGRPYLVTELVRGQTLAELPRPIARETLSRIGLGLARGLAAAHRQGVLHRDLKPANVMVAEDGEVKLLDFGLAKLLDRPVREDAAPGLPRAPASSDLTGAGGMLGTPLYMAPECLRGEPATQRSDLYSLGAVLYELCAGVAPRQTVAEGTSFEAWAAAEPVPLSQAAKNVDPGLAAIIARCLQVEPEHRFASAEELCAALGEAGPERVAGDIPEGNPYRGLQPFEAEHRALFFGRSTEVDAVLERLRAEPFVVVTGDSGVGKSSLCRAGVLPRVVEGALGDGRRYRAVSLVPGRHPVEALTTTVSGLIGADEGTASREGWSGAGALRRELLRAQGRSAGTLVFIDQLEELFTLVDAEQAARFGEEVTALAMLPGVRVLMTVRGDFFTRMASLPGLGAEVARSLYLLRPLTPEAARAVIAGPARRKGFQFESEALVDTLVEAASRSAGGLPLLQFAMAELWEARDEAARRIPASALDAIGGVDGALARHADGVLAGLFPDQRRAARRLLMALVTREGTSRRRTGVELDAGEPSARVALDALVRGRLLVAREADGETTYEVAHEALPRGWGTLREWLDSDGGKRQVRERVESAAAEWVRLERNLEALWSERQLAEARDVDGDEVSSRGAEFLESSRAAVRRARLRRRMLGVGIPLAVVLVLGGVRLQSRWEVSRKVEAAEVHGASVLEEGRLGKQVADRLRREAYAFFEQGGGTAEETAASLAKAEAAWKEALSTLKKADGALAEAGKAFEAALALDPSNLRMRGRVGDVLVERIELAEWFHQRERRDDLVQRLELYDDEEGRRQRWLRKPPRLQVKTSPPDAEVWLERYEDQGYRRPGPARLLGRTPLRDVEVGTGPGSYRLTFRAAGRVPVHYPVLLARGEHLALDLALPAAGRVPEGFVHVPEGRFLLGSADPEGMRSGIMKAPPLHESRTGAFLIARREVTFEEWLRFLESLPPDEAERRKPTARLRAWGMDLDRLSDASWRFTLILNERRVTAHEGQSLVLPDRDRRREQDWKRLPATGLSYEDARVYMAWLRKTGQVPGARLCTEREWERVTRGADDRLYPHGDLIAPDDANFDETYGRKTYAFGPDEVGSHPASVSPFGLEDLTGNVYELTDSMWTRGEIVIRGGSWYYDSVAVLAANRTPVEPKTRDMGTGLRVCADPPPLERP